MRKPKITTSYNEHRNREVVCYQTMTGIFRERKAHESSKTTEIYTHVSKQSLACLPARLAKIQSPLDRFLSDKKSNNNNL